MLNLKSINVITLTFAMSAMATHVSAQVNTGTLENTQMQAAKLTVKSAEAKLPVTPKIKRGVNRLAAPASATQTQHKNVYGQTFYANTSKKNAPTRFIYRQHKEDMPMPVYFSEDANKAK